MNSGVIYEKQGEVKSKFKTEPKIVRSFDLDLSWNGIIVCDQRIVLSLLEEFN